MTHLGLDHRQVHDVDVADRAAEIREVVDRQGVEGEIAAGQVVRLLRELQQVQSTVDGRVLLGDVQDPADLRRAGERAGLAQLVGQRRDEGLLPAFPVQVGEVVEVDVLAPGVPSLPDERKRLRRVDLLLSGGEGRTGERVVRCLLQAHRDRLHDLGDLEERDQRDLDEVVDRHPAEELADRVDLFLAAGVARRLFQGVAGEPLRVELVVGLVARQPVGLFDLLLALLVRAARQVDVVVAGNGDLHRAAVCRSDRAPGARPAPTRRNRRAWRSVGPPTVSAGSAAARWGAGPVA